MILFQNLKVTQGCYCRHIYNIISKFLDTCANVSITLTMFGQCVRVGLFGSQTPSFTTTFKKSRCP